MRRHRRASGCRARHSRGLPPGEDILRYQLAQLAQLAQLGSDADIDWQLLDASRELLQKHYPQALASWAGEALAGSNVLAFADNVVRSFPKLLNSGDARDALARLRPELAQAWGESLD